MILYQRLDRTSRAPYSASEYFRKLLWNTIGALMFRWSPRSLMHLRVGIVNLFGGRIHRTVVLRRTARIWHPWLLMMEEHSCLGEEVVIYNLGPVHIGSHTVLSQRVHLCNGTHDISSVTLPLKRPSMRIGSGVWICADAFIGPGVIVGDNAIVGARAVVTKGVNPAVIVAGNPAREIRCRPRPTDAALTENCTRLGENGS